MANKIEYAQNEISNNQGNKVTITIIRLVCENECEDARRQQILEQAKEKIMGNKPYKIFKDDQNYEFMVIEGENELEFTDITNQILQSC